MTIERTSSTRKRVRGRIGTTLVVYFIALAVVPVIVVVAVALNLVDRQMHQQVFNQLESVTQLKVNQIERYLAVAQGTLRQMTADRDQYLRMMSAAQGGSASDELLAAALQDQLAAQALFSELFIYDLKGKILVSTTARQEGKVVVARPYFEPSLAGEYVQPPFYELSAGELNMVISRPLISTTGNVAGVLAGRVSVDALNSIMTERAGLGDTGETYLVSLENNYFLTDSRFEGVARNRAYHSEGIDRSLAGNDGTGIYPDYRGVTSFGVYRWLPELQAGLLAEIEASEALAALDQVRVASNVVGVIAAALAAVIGIGVAIWITRPIGALTQAASRIAGGDYSLQAPVTRNNEIGQLAEAFNVMTAQLVESIDKLDHNVHELDHANRELRVATAQAREASRLKDEFLAVMSHELRTPLNAIIGFLGIIQMTGNLEERNLHMVQRIRANAERLLGLINDVLDISRIEAGRLQLYPIDVSLSRMAQRLGDSMSVLAEQKGIEFSVTVDSHLPPTVHMDEDAVTKIITNLLSNAFKFTSQGEVALAIRGVGTNLVIEVTDSGVGIPPHMHEIIFERFRQVDGTSTRAHGGSGLGLSIVQHLCNAMNGSVRVDSAVSKGSTFTVTLPVLQAVLEPA